VSALKLSPGRQVLALAVALTALRLVAAAFVPLTEDEAYYRLWAQHLQFGYYDHPPMIAWWIRLGELAAGDTPFGIRLLPCLATGLTTWLVGDLALRLGFGEAVGPRAALWYNATLTVGLGGMLAIPDAPASAFWMLTLWSLARMWTSRNALWWLAAGAAAGLSVLSKYSGLFLAPGVLLWLIAVPGGRAELKRPWPWVAAALAAAVFAPNVAWNAAHGWATFARQFGRVAPQGLHPAHLPEFLLTQALLLNPLIAFHAARGVRRIWRERAAPLAAELALPVLTSVPFAAYLLLHSLHDRVQGHWPVPLFGGLAVCAAAAVGTARPWSARLAAPLGVAVSALGLAHMALPRPAALGVFDPTLALRGWPAFADDVERLRVAQHAAWVGVQSYGVLAQLDAQRRIRAPLLEVFERRRYDPALGLRPDFSRAGLVLDLDRRVVRADLLRCFAVVEPAGFLERGWVGGPVVRYTAFRVSGPKRDVWTRGCPEEIHPGVWI
jgi:4-amino-4-deoxy-L-arabinose transferase-like glycosyltransferase